MGYYCEICNMRIRPKSKSRHFKSNNHNHLDKQKHIKLMIKNPVIDNIGKIFYSHINEYDKKYENYLVRCQYKLCFINMEHYGVASSKLTDNKTMVSWKIFVQKNN